MVLPSLGSSKPALGQDVGQMLWCGASEHARGARPCLQTGPVALLRLRVLWSYGTGGGGGETCAVDWIDIVLSLSPWGCWLG